MKRTAVLLSLFVACHHEGTSVRPAPPISVATTTGSTPAAVEWWCLSVPAALVKSRCAAPAPYCFRGREACDAEEPYWHKQYGRCLEGTKLCIPATAAYCVHGLRDGVPFEECYPTHEVCKIENDYSWWRDAASEGYCKPGKATPPPK